MKRVVYLSVLCLLSISCSEFAEVEPMPVEILVAVGDDNTRGERIFLSRDLDDIGVVGYSSPMEWRERYDVLKPDAACNLRFYHTPREWRCDAPIYWDDIPRRRLTLFAYSPFEGCGGVSFLGADEGLQLRYSVDSECSLQPDLMISEVAEDCTSEVGAVTLRMHSVLCAVCFETAEDIDLMSVELRDVVCSTEINVNRYGEVEWILAEPTSLVINISSTDESLMMIPQSFGGDASMIVTYSIEGGELIDEKIVLTAEQWDDGGVVSYTLSTTLHIEPIP